MNNINLNQNNYIRFKSSEQALPQAIQNNNVVQNITGNVQIPDLYRLNIETKDNRPFKEKFKKYDPVGLISPFVENPLLGGLTAFTIIKGVDAYANACGGEYEKSILGKATKFGDDIATSESGKKFLGGIQKAINKCKEIFNRSDLLKAMKETPAIPEKEIASYELKPQAERFIEDFNKITGTYFKEEKDSLFTGFKEGFNKIFNKSDGWVKINELGLNKAEKEALKKSFKVTSLSKIEPNELINWTLLKRLDVPEAEINSIIKSSNATEQVKTRMLKAMNLTLEEVKDIKLNPAKHIDKVAEVTSKVRDKIRIGAGRYDIFGPFQPLERTISMDQVANRLHSIKIGPDGGAKTKLGALCAKVLHKIYRGFTFGGGKLGMMLMIVPGMVMAFNNIKKADKEEKVGTAANGIITAISWVFTFPLSIAATYALGGMQYAGMGKEKVQQCRDLVKKFNAAEFADKAAYDSALKTLKGQLKELKTVKNQNLLTKIGRGISKFFYQDLGQIKPFQDGNAGKNLLRSLPNRLKNLSLEPIRFVLFMFAMEPLFHKVIEGCTKAVFGKHYNEEREAEYESKQEEQKKFLKEDLMTRLSLAQQEKIQGVQESSTSPEFNPPENLQKIIHEERIKNKREKLFIKNYGVQEASKNTSFAPITSKNDPAKAIASKGKAININQKQNIVNETFSEQDNYNYTPSQNQKLKNTTQKEIKYDNYTYIPSSENKIAHKESKDEVQKYIPSQNSKVPAKTFDNSGLEAALRRADKAEQKAIEILSGNFGN